MHGATSLELAMHTRGCMEFVPSGHPSFTRHLKNA